MPAREGEKNPSGEAAQQLDFTPSFSFFINESAPHAFNKALVRNNNETSSYQRAESGSQRSSNKNGLDK